MASKKVPAVGGPADRVSAERLIALLGHSIESPDLRAVMTTLRLDEPQPLIDTSGNKYDAWSGKPEDEVSLTFDGYVRFQREYGDPLSISDRSVDELVLSSFMLTSNRVALPSGVAIGDSSTSVISKLGKKPAERSSDLHYGHAWRFQFDEYFFITAFDKKLRLIWLAVHRISSNMRAQIQLKRSLGRQNANIDPKSAKSILALRRKLPTTAWKRRMADGDATFTTAAIQATATLLEEYLATVADHASKKKAANIHNSIKRVVRSLNKINKKHDGFIETVEREELCLFLDEVVRLTGLEVVGDLTEEWRDW